MYHMRLRGLHRDMGFKIGKALQAGGQNLYALSELDDFQREFGLASQKILFERFPAVREEICGAAEAMRFPAERLAAWLMTMGCCYDVRGCTAFAFRSGGKVYFGRNNDLPPFLKKLSCSALYQPTDTGYKFLLNTSSFINGEEGVNERGFACAMTFVPPNPNEIRPGFNSMFIVRYLLESAECVSEALSLLMDLPVASACNILLADASGELAACECCSTQLNIDNNREFVYITNEFLSADMKRHSSVEHGPYFSSERAATCERAFRGRRGEPLEFAKNLLAGKFGFLCAYPKSCGFDTIWSSVFCLGDKRILRAEGNPSRTAFREDGRAKFLFGQRERAGRNFPPGPLTPLSDILF